MALKWNKAKYGSYIAAGNWTINPFANGFTLKFGWHCVCILKTEAGCKRVANCIHRETEKDRT